MKKILAISLALALIGVLGAPLTVYAAGGSSNDTATVTADEGAVYSITVPETISLLAAPNGSSSVSSAQFQISVSTNDPANAQVALAVKGVDGKLSSGSNILQPALDISSSTLNWNHEGLSSSDVVTNNKLDATSGSAQVTNVFITQPAVTDPSSIPAGTYQEVLTFTATFASN